MAKIQRHTEAFAGPLQRRPRVSALDHLDFIRSLPCLVCGTPDRTEAAHIRMASLGLAKRETGKGEKPSDCWTVPLCNAHHREQHGMRERGFWARYEIRGLVVALALWAATGDYDRGLQIIKRNKP